MGFCGVLLINVVTCGQTKGPEHHQYMALGTRSSIVHRKRADQGWAMNAGVNYGESLEFRQLVSDSLDLCKTINYQANSFNSSENKIKFILV